MLMLQMLFSIYLIGVIMTFIVGFEGISRHITWKKLKTTFIMSLFSFFALWYMVLGGGGKRYNNF